MEYRPIRASVSSETITKVTRLFNGSPADIVNELIQNSRRAGASQISFSVQGIEGNITLVTIADNGCGIDDPSRMLALGSSRWGEEVSASEDPAGMGVFSLAGKQVTIFSRHASQESAWYAEIDPDAWTGDKEIPLSATERDVGTTITFELVDAKPEFVESEITKAARFCPVFIELNGAELESKDFLADAIYVEEWNGSRIGIFKGNGSYHGDPTVNFHGLTLNTTLAVLDEGINKRLHARLDIGSTPNLQLVLPARKEFVENATLEDLKISAERAIYRTIAERGEHDLPFSVWERAQDLGVDLPEARAKLRSWVPGAADDHAGGEVGAEVDVTDEHILCEDFEAYIAQSFNRAILGTDLKARLVDTDRHYVGYSWYNKLRRVSGLQFAVTAGQNKYLIHGTNPDDDSEEPDTIPEILKADRITAKVTVTGPQENASSIHEFDSDVAFDFPEDYWTEDLDSLLIVCVPNDKLTPDLLADLMKGAAFSSNEDSGADAWETQNDAFESEALSLAYKILVSEDAAIISSFEDALKYKTPLIPDGKVLHIEVRKSVDYKFDLRDDDPAGYAARSAKALDLVARMAAELEEDQEGDVVLPWAYIAEQSDDEDFDLDDESNKHNPLWVEIKAIAEGSDEAPADAPRREANFFGVWEDHPSYPAEDWQYEVANGDTRAGYWDWVQTKVDADREERAEKAAERATDDQAR